MAAAAGETTDKAPGSSFAGRAARATGMMIVFVLLSRVLGVLRDIVLARYFGQNTITDIYNAAFRVPDTLYLLVAGGALSSVFVPVFTQYLTERREAEAWKTFGAFITLVAAAAAALVLVMALLAAPVNRLLFPLFSESEVARTATLSRIVLPAQWCFFVGGLMMGVLQARGRFLIPALGPVIYNLAIIAGGVAGGLLYPDNTLVGISLMTWGALLGAVTGNFLLPLWDLNRSGAQWMLGFDFRHPGVVKIGQLLLPALLGLSLSQLGFWITQSFLPAGGQISALKYAYNLTQAPIGIFAQASAIVLFPTISALAARGDWAAFRSEISHGIRRILFLTVPASFLMAVLAEPIIRLLYAGPKFGDSEIAQATVALRLYSIGTFAWSAQAVLGRGFFAMQDTKTPLSITKVMIILFTLLCFVLNHLIGFEGLALAMSLVATINMAVFLALLGRRVDGLDVHGLARSGGRIFAASTLASGAAWGTLGVLDPLFPDTKITAVLLLTLAGGIALGVYAAACVLLRVPEIKTVRVMFRRAGAAPPAGEQP